MTTVTFRSVAFHTYTTSSVALVETSKKQREPDRKRELAREREREIQIDRERRRETRRDKAGEGAPRGRGGQGKAGRREGAWTKRNERV